MRRIRAHGRGRWVCTPKDFGRAPDLWISVLNSRQVINVDKSRPQIQNITALVLPGYRIFTTYKGTYDPGQASN